MIEKRLLRPKDDEARKKLGEAFTAMQRQTGRAYSTLVAGEDTDAFQKLYPFSPALVETLVALSTALSRHRTAIKLLAEILVDHIPDLKLGELVLLGDVFDVLHDDMADGMLRHRLRDAKKLYGNVLPVIQAQHGTMTPERCQRLRSDGEHKRSLGCSGCAERPCRSDNRLMTDKKLLERARAVLEPLGVALVREDTVHVHADARLRPIEQTRQQKNVDEPTWRRSSRGPTPPSAPRLGLRSRPTRSAASST